MRKMKVINKYITYCAQTTAKPISRTTEEHLH